MEAKYTGAELSCNDCGFILMRGETMAGAHYLTCVNPECVHYRQKFRQPTLELQPLHKEQPQKTSCEIIQIAGEQ